MIVWGNGGDLVDLAHEQVQACATCGQNRPFKVFLKYRYFHLYWVFGAITERNHLQLCDICRRGTEIPKEQLSLFNVQAIQLPFMRRFGLLALAGLIAAFVGWSIYNGR
jgi:hypothetical protein